LKFFGKYIKPVFPPSHKKQIVTALREAICIDFADSCRSASDDCHSLILIAHFFIPSVLGMATIVPSG
jgi:hypothetical protein